jgi:hypothetical protein
MKSITINWIFFLFLLSAGNILFAQEVEVTGSWEVDIDVTDMTGGPGSDLNPTYESDVDQIDVAIKGKKTKEWQLYVKRSDWVWDPNFQLFVRRTSDGVGSGYIAGGLDYLEVTESDQLFYYGGKNRSKVNVQLKLDNVSVAIPYDVYTTNVVYTVIEP